MKSLFYICFTLLLTGFTPYRQAVEKEHNLKAAFIYNFTMFIDWDTITGNEFIIGIIGPSPIKESLAEIARAKTVHGKPIVIRQFNNLQDITFCHLLFISRDVSFPLADILEKSATKGTLFVGEKPGCASEGAAINFVIIDEKLKFEVNTKALDRAGFKASSQLLKLAIIIN